jgi:beta-galactosidase beta subunit
VKKLLACIVLLAFLAPSPAYGGGHKANEYVKYKNQKSGQFCAAKDMNKLVKLPSSMILVCKMEGNMHRWKPKGQM